MSSDMRNLTPTEYVARTEMLGRLGKDFKELLFGKLRKTARHRYGTLKAWVKGKTFLNGMPGSWEEVVLAADPPDNSVTELIAV